MDTLVNAAGCDSIVYYELTVNYSVYDTVVDTADGQYVWHDSIYTTSGIYDFYGWTAEGCDSIVSLVLTIDTSAGNALQVVVVGNVTISGCENGVVVRGAAHQQVYAIDAVGRIVSHVSSASDDEFIRLSQTGVYLVKVGDLPARRVVVR